MKTATVHVKAYPGRARSVRLGFIDRGFKGFSIVKEDVDMDKDDERQVKIAKAIAKLLMDGKPRTAEEIRLELGLTVDQMLSSVTGLRRRGAVRSIPKTYVITPRGVKYAQRVPLTPAERMARARAADKRRKTVEDRKTNEVLETIVGDALSSRPVLQSVWGAAHA
jgi:hypothetical protein